MWKPGDSWARHASRLVLPAGAAVGLVCFFCYYLAGLTTLHYDAKAHLVVARRIVDSRLPGYAQMGAHWLPLVHLLYLPFIWSDAQYRTALLPSLISVVSFAVSGWLAYRIARRAGAPAGAALVAPAVLLGNPNLQFLQSAPLSEPLSMMLALLFVDSLTAWRGANGRGLPWQVALWGALGALCRYEGWLLPAGAILLLLYDHAARRLELRRAIRAAALVGGAAALPLLLHFGYIYLELGDSIFHRVARGYGAPELTYRRPLLSAVYHFGEVAQAATLLPLVLGVAGTVVCLLRPRDLGQRAPLLLLWSPALVNIAALYWGLIYRVRYSVLLVPALAVWGSLMLDSAHRVRAALIACALAPMMLPWLSWAFPREWNYHFMYPGPGVLLLPVCALLLLFWVLAGKARTMPLVILLLLGMHLPVLEGEHKAALQEAREHEYQEPQRRRVIEGLRNLYDGTGILIDMARHAPLIYDSGLPVREFVYNEGRADLWHRAVAAPRSVVGWLCGERGDAVWERLRADPDWARGYTPVVETEDFVLYRLDDEYRRALMTGREPG